MSNQTHDQLNEWQKFLVKLQVQYGDDADLSKLYSTTCLKANDNSLTAPLAFPTGPIRS